MTYRKKPYYKYPLPNLTRTYIVESGNASIVRLFNGKSSVTLPPLGVDIQQSLGQRMLDTGTVVVKGQGGHSLTFEKIAGLKAFVNAVNGIANDTSAPTPNTPTVQTTPQLTLDDMTRKAFVLRDFPETLKLLFWETGYGEGGNIRPPIGTVMQPGDTIMKERRLPIIAPVVGMYMGYLSQDYGHERELLEDAKVKLGTVPGYTFGQQHGPTVDEFLKKYGFRTDSDMGYDAVQGFFIPAKSQPTNFTVSDFYDIKVIEKIIESYLSGKKSLPGRYKGSEDFRRQLIDDYGHFKQERALIIPLTELPPIMHPVIIGTNRFAENFSYEDFQEKIAILNPNTQTTPASASPVGMG